MDYLNEKKSRFQVLLKYDPIYLAISIIFLFTFVNGFFNSLATAFGIGFPFNTFLYNPTDIFADIIKVAAAYPGELPKELLHRPEWEINYFTNNPYGGIEALRTGNLSILHTPPLPTLLYLSARSILNFYSSTILVFFTTLLWLLPLILTPYIITKNKQKIFFLSTTIILCYPVLMSITRGNISSGLTATAIIFSILLASKKRNPFFIAFLLSLAFNFRPNSILFILVPFVYFSLFGAVRIIIYFLISTIVIFCASLYFSNLIYYDYSFSNWIKGLNIYYNLYVIGDGGILYGSSLFGAIKLVLYSIGLKNLNLALINYSISFILGVFLLLFIYYLWSKKITKVNFIFILCSIYTLSSSVFADYHLIVFLSVIILAPQKIQSNDFVKYIPFIFSALILSPKNFIFIKGYSLQTVLNPILLTLALIIFLFHLFNLQKLHKFNKN
jgi:hypothetical protein